MERQIDSEFNYIEGITIEDLEKTIHRKDLEDFGEYSTKMIKNETSLILKYYLISFDIK